MEQEELDAFRDMLVELRPRLASNVAHIQSDGLRDGGDGGNLSDMPLEHLADRGSDTFVRDLMIGVLESSEAEVCDIDSALEKIDAGTYGACETCNVNIARARLKALPFARLCIQCKQVEEQQADR